MRRADREGYCQVCMIDGNGRYILTREHYAPLRDAWMRGEAFYTGVDHFGAPVTIKLGRVEGVSDLAPEGLAAAIDDEAQDKQDRVIRGED